MLNESVNLNRFRLDVRRSVGHVEHVPAELPPLKPDPLLGPDSGPTAFPAIRPANPVILAPAFLGDLLHVVTVESSVSFQQGRFELVEVTAYGAFRVRQMEQASHDSNWKNPHHGDPFVGPTQIAGGRGISIPIGFHRCRQCG